MPRIKKKDPKQASMIATNEAALACVLRIKKSDEHISR